VEFLRWITHHACRRQPLIFETLLSLDAQMFFGKSVIERPTRDALR
jgi:hypothetical protein